MGEVKQLAITIGEYLEITAAYIPSQNDSLLGSDRLWSLITHLSRPKCDQRTYYNEVFHVEITADTASQR